jgi:hypothetical protein
MYLSYHNTLKNDDITFSSDDERAKGSSPDDEIKIKDGDI